MSGDAHDFAILNGTVVLDGGAVEKVNVGVRHGRIATLTSDSIAAERTLDARGLTIMPGVVDEHFHSWWGHGFESHRHATRAAAKGGVTTVIEMPLDVPLTLTAEALQRKNEALIDDYYVDHAAHGGYIGERPEELDGIARAGAVSCKIFTGDVAPPGTYPATDDGEALDAMRRCAALGIPLVAHCENAEIAAHETARLRAEGADGPAAWASARALFGEVDAVQRICLLAASTGCRTVVAHNSAPECLLAIDAGRRAGGDVWAESCPHLLCASHEDPGLDTRFKWNPPTRGRAAVEEMWRLLDSGLLHTIGSDHGTVPKDPLMNVWDQSPGAGNSIETMLAVFASEAVHARGVRIERVAEMLCTRPAKIFGLYPRKGAILVGADADFAIVETAGERTIEAGKLEFLLDSSRWSPFEGRKVSVYPVFTVLRGEVICKEDEVIGGAGAGRFVPGPSYEEPR